MNVTRANLIEVLKLPKSERLALFQSELKKVLKHLPHNYAAITAFRFPQYSSKESRTHVYNVKNGIEDWDILFFWKESFMPLKSGEQSSLSLG